MAKFNLDMGKLAGGLAEGTLTALGTGLLGMAGTWLTKMAISAIKSKSVPAIDTAAPDLSGAVTMTETATESPTATETIELTAPTDEVVMVSFEGGESGS